jgi:hypothetical protein
MARILKTLGLALTTIIAMWAVGSAVAQATGPFFKTVESPATVTGTKIAGEQFIKTNAGKTECTGSQWSATIVKQNTSMLLKNAYSGCTLGGAGATVELNGCEFNLNLVSTSSPPTATVDLICPGSNEVTIKSGTCVIHIAGNQMGLKHATFTNTPNKVPPFDDIDMTLAVSGIKYTTTALCPGGAVAKSDGEYKEKVTLQAENGVPEPLPLWVE